MLVPKFIDLTDTIIYSVHVVGRAKDQYTSGGHLKVMWNCECLECGKQFITDGQCLRKGHTTSCGCLGMKHRADAARRQKREDLTNQIFNWLQVDGPAEDYVKPNGKHVSMWNCTCLRCGNKTTTSSESLKKEKTKSCGCLKREHLGEKTFISLDGRTFGDLYVESRAEDRYLPNGKPVVMYNCVCSCGQRIIVSGKNLRSGNTKSCGHIGASYGESVVLNLLKKENIRYSHDSGFSDLKTSRGGYPRFDFKVYDSNKILVGLIEIQGLQHYKERKNSDFGQFQREETDQLKRDYCLAHNIPLYEIRYDEDFENRTYEILKEMNVLHVNPVPSELIKFEGQTTIP